MVTQHPDRGIGGRALLGLLAAGFTFFGAFIFTMEYPEPRPEGGLVTLLALPGLGLLGAGVGRALGRWVLAGYGVILIGGAADLLISSYTRAPGPGRSVVVIYATTILLGCLALALAIRSFLARRHERAESWPTRPSEAPPLSGTQ